VSFQAYLDTVKKITGKSPEQFRVLADKKGLLQPQVKAGDVIAWLKADFGLGHGHAMAIFATFKRATEPQRTLAEQVEERFSGSRAGWQQPYRQLLTKIEKFGPGVTVKPTDSYISLLRDGKKFAIVHVSAARLDIGIKLKKIAPSYRLTLSGKWNAMVTHRVRIENENDIDSELLGWLRLAYEQA
jgi:hypothetical protein